MMLVQSILKGLRDERALAAHVAVASPTRDLVEQYNKIALYDDNLPKITALSTGRQLKEGIEMLDPQDQVTLLHKYSMAIKSLDTPDEYSDTMNASEKRQMRLFAFRACVIVLAMITLIMVGVTLTVAVKSNSLPNDSALKGIVSTIGEIVKFILSTK
jgi:hypothetical protein